MKAFDPKSLIDLDTCVINALDLFMDPKTKFPRPNLTKFKRPLVVGSGNAIATGRIIFDGHDAVFADEGTYQGKLDTIKKIDGVILLSASGGKHAPIIAEDVRARRRKIELFTCNPAPLAKDAVNECHVFPSRPEPYTYNTSTYMGMMMACMIARPRAEARRIRDHIRKEYGSAGIPRIEIERTGEAVNVIIYTARPGVLVGRKGVRIDQLKAELQKIAGMTVHLTIHEVKRPELSAPLVAEVIADALKRRMAFRRAIKKAIMTTMQAGAKGIKVEINGRLGGADMARTAKEREGRVPLSTLQANVEYGTAEGRTTYGIIGVKVWIYKGDIDRGEKVNYRQAAGGGSRLERGGPRGRRGGGGGGRRGGGDR